MKKVYFYTETKSHTKIFTHDTSLDGRRRNQSRRRRCSSRDRFGRHDHLGGTKHSKAGVLEKEEVWWDATAKVAGVGHSEKSFGDGEVGFDGPGLLWENGSGCGCSGDDGGVHADLEWRSDQAGLQPATLD